MRIFEKIDLKPFMNHKVIYEKLPEEGTEFGLDNICILKEDFKFRREERINGIEFRFETGETDNIMCEKQSLKVGETIKKLHLVGFAYWGNIHDFLRIIYADGEEAMLKVGLADWSHSADAEIYIREFFKEDDISTAKIVLSSGRFSHLVYFHLFSGEVKADKPIREIILPDNMFMHIFAITLERESEDID